MLSGTDYTNIVNDYLESYKNNNGLDFLTNPEIAKEIEVQKIQKLIYYINGNQDFKKTNLEEIAYSFLQRYGMLHREIQILQQKICQ